MVTTLLAKAAWRKTQVIISHSRRFIFVKTKKTAGTSLEIALSKYCDDSDILAPLVDYDETLRRRIAKRGVQNHQLPWRECRPRHLAKAAIRGVRPWKYHEHMTAVEILEYLGPQIWNDYYKFTVVRNPYDRILSDYFWKMGEAVFNKYKIENIGQFVRYFPERIATNWRIYSRGDSIMVDDVVRFENFATDLKKVSDKIGLDHNIYEDFREIKTKSKHRPAGASVGRLLGPQEMRLIYELSRPEFERFGYEPVPPMQEPRGSASADAADRNSAQGMAV